MQFTKKLGPPPAISSDVVIMTRAELEAREHVAFQRGVERGRMTAGEVNTKIPRPLDNGDTQGTPVRTGTLISDQPGSR